jgi:cell division protein FtsL
MSVWAVAISSLQDILQSRAKSAVATDAPVRRTPRRFVPGAPEVYFHKAIDNTRLVKLDDPIRKREMRMFTVAVSVIFILCTVYVWQHFRAIEYGYNIEAAKQERDHLIDVKRNLQLEEASLKDPQRIDRLAKAQGYGVPNAGQIQQMDAVPESNGPVMARAAGVTVVSLSQ